MLATFFVEWRKNQPLDLRLAYAAALIQSLERAKHRRVAAVTFSIEEQPVPDGH
jgi:hypothetical protein